jgi:hypothetical protein
MPRDLQRVCLQHGLKLDLNRLIRDGIVRSGERTGPISIQWINRDTGGIRTSGKITSDLLDGEAGWFHFESRDLDQRIHLVAQARHFGGRQWYFSCPFSRRSVSVLWKPPGARQFSSRQRWVRRIVAYRSQFLAPHDRAHAGQAKIKSRLIGALDPDEWDLPPKPKWMRWSTYNRYVERHDAYEAVLDSECALSASMLRKFLV